MAKLRGAAKAKFLARMARGRRKAGRKTHRKARSKSRKRNPIGATIMPSALIVNPSRKRRKKSHGRKRRHHARRRRNILVPMGNPRRRGRARRRHNQILSNPVGAIKQMIPGAMAAIAAGGIIGIVDAKTAGKSQLISYGAKIGAAVAGMYFNRKLPFGLGNALFTAGLSSIGYAAGLKFGGGLVIPGAKTPAGTAELSAAIGEDEELASLLDADLRGHGMGLLVSTGGGGMSALVDTIGDDGEGEMGDALSTEYNEDA